MPYAYLDAGQPVEILPGVPFSTPQVRIAEDEVEYFRDLLAPLPADLEDAAAVAAAEAARSAIVAGTVVDHLTQHVADALERYSAEDLAHCLIQSFAEAAAPAAGQLVEARVLQVAGGVISIQATYAAIPVEQARAEQLAAVAAQYDQRRQSPMGWNFGSIEAKADTGETVGAAGGQTLQMRDAPDQDDLKNWLAAAQGASAMMMGGAGATILPLKTTANVWVQTTAAEVLQVLVTGDGTQPSALARGQAMLARYGALKAQINAAADAAAALAIDVAAGWPA